MEKLAHLLDLKRGYFDDDGIFITQQRYSGQLQVSKECWEKIYDYDLNQLHKDRADFDECKLKDHMSFIHNAYRFNRETIYLEIGCGPSHVGDYLMSQYDVSFVGIDFNYKLLRTLKQYFDQKGYVNYLLIHGDICDLPLKNNIVDFIYGGGVIEHVKDTRLIVHELYRVLKPGGVSFNTVPAFNVMWCLRFYNNIPSYSPLKRIFEFIHIALLKNNVLKKYSGYELSFTTRQLMKSHEAVGFTDIQTGPFVFHPTKKKVASVRISNFIYAVQKYHWFAPVFYIQAKKAFYDDEIGIRIYNSEISKR